MTEKTIHYIYTTRGYMLYYLNHPIYGAGIDKHAKGSRLNLKLFHDCAASEKRNILNGHVPVIAREQIDKINEKLKEKFLDFAKAYPDKETAIEKFFDVICDSDFYPDPADPESWYNDVKLILKDF